MSDRMIEWMNKHKKWLVVTIWVSVIALISAGMVGWDPSGFSASNDQVAKVGNTKITQQEFSEAYQRVFNEYNQVLGGDLDQNEAKNLGLDRLALNQLVQRIQARNFAKDLGLRVEDTEVAKLITSEQAFQRDGRFDESLYRQLLKENHISIKSFEESVRDTLLIQKLQELIPMFVSPFEQESIGSSLSLTDEVVYEILKPDPSKEKISEEMTRSFWEKNKSKYTNPASVQMEVITIPIATQKYTQKQLLDFYNQDQSLYIDQQGNLKNFEEVKDKVLKDFQDEEARKESLRIYQRINNKEAGLNFVKVDFELDSEDNKELAQQIENLKVGDVVRPFPYKDSYAVGRIIKKITQSEQTFMQAKNQAEKDLSLELAMNKLKLKAQNSLPLKKGKTIQISPIQEVNIPSLSKQEIQLAVNHIFESKKKSGAVDLDGRIFVYTIKGQRLAASDSQEIESLVGNVKYQAINLALITYLERKYPVKYYNKNLELGVKVGQ